MPRQFLVLQTLKEEKYPYVAGGLYLLTGGASLNQPGLEDFTISRREGSFLLHVRKHDALPLLVRASFYMSAQSARHRKTKPVGINDEEKVTVLTFHLLLDTATCSIGISPGVKISVRNIVHN